MLLDQLNKAKQSMEFNFSLDVTTGQRKYGGPPPAWEGPSPGNGCEVSAVYFKETIVLRRREDVKESGEGAG